MSPLVIDNTVKPTMKRGEGEEKSTFKLGEKAMGVKGGTQEYLRFLFSKITTYMS